MSSQYIVYRAVFLLIVFLFSGCKGDDIDPVTEPTHKEESENKEDEVVVIDPSTIDVSKIYIPEELRRVDFYKSTSPWFYGRSRQSDHFIVFWGQGYGDNDPNSSEIPATFRVDIDDLLEKAEEYFRVNIEELKFAKLGEGNTYLDEYKMMIFLFYQEDWLATGAGYDNVIGALWVSPGTCQPVGSTIAHEIAHSFQYQVHCDIGETSGFRYGFGGNGGNSFWEQCAQWQAYQSYPDQVFGSHHFSVHMSNYFRHLCHEWHRYASYFIHYYWADKHGKDIIARIWQEARQPEDPVEAYMRLTGINVEEFNDEMYDAATRFVTWDIEAIRELGSDYIGAHTYKCDRLEDGSYQVTYDRCPGTTGYNVIHLNVPEPGTEISAAFTGLPNAPGYNTVNESRAGWRYGFVAFLNDGNRVYGDMYQGLTNTASFTVPDNCDRIWFVVTGAPVTYAPHPWDEDESNDDQWPYKVKFENTDLFGNIEFDGSEQPQHIIFSYDVVFSSSTDTYQGTIVELGSDLIQLARAFVLQPNEITNKMSNGITFYAIESTGELNDNYTANGYGHWFDETGNVSYWGNDESRIFSEFDETNFTFSIGQYPGRCASGDRFTIQQALVFEFEPGKLVQASFSFNITIQ